MANFKQFKAKAKAESARTDGQARGGRHSSPSREARSSPPSEGESEYKSELFRRLSDSFELS